MGILATLVILTIGVTYGSIAGFRGGALDRTMMRLVDILDGLPFIFLVIVPVVLSSGGISSISSSLSAPCSG